MIKKECDTLGLVDIWFYEIYLLSAENLLNIFKKLFTMK